MRSVESVPVADGREYRVQPAGRRPAATLRSRTLYDLARERDWPLRELRREVRTLETVFGELTRSQLAAAEQGVEG